jgi:hypothetical protein
VIVEGKRAKVPRIRFVIADLDLMHGFEFSDLLMAYQRSVIHAFVLSIFFVFFLLLLLVALFFVFLFDYFLVGGANPGERDPLIVSTIQGFIMDVILIRRLIFLFRSVII